VRDNKRTIRIHHVLFSVFHMTGSCHFLQLLSIWQPPIFVFPSPCNPTTMGNTKLYRNIKSGLVSAGLTTGDDLTNHHGPPSRKHQTTTLAFVPHQESIKPLLWPFSPFHWHDEKNPIPLKETWGSSIQAYSPRFAIFHKKPLPYISIGDAVWKVKGYNPLTRVTSRCRVWVSFFWLCPWPSWYAGLRL